MNRPRLLLATNNKGKIREYRKLLTDIPFDLISPAELGITLEVEETGTTFEENAILKAQALSEASGLPALADDSGLEVDALNGEPGIRSARYAGEDATDAEKVQYLLSRLEGIPTEQRTARFRCVIAITTPDGQIRLCEGTCEGTITLKATGTSGFGYDPIFYIPELQKTMAELPMETKNRISHRGRAARKAAELLRAGL